MNEWRIFIIRTSWMNDRKKIYKWRMCLEIKMSSKHIVIVVDLSILEYMMMMMMNWNRMRELFFSLSLTHLQTQSNTKELWRISFNHNHHHHYYHWWWWMKKWTANKRREKNSKSMLGQIIKWQWWWWWWWKYID